MIFNTMLLKQLIVGKTRMLDKTQKLLLMFIVYFGLVFQKTMCAFPPHLYNPQVWIFFMSPLDYPGWDFSSQNGLLPSFRVRRSEK